MNIYDHKNDVAWPSISDIENSPFSCTNTVFIYMGIKRTNKCIIYIKPFRFKMKILKSIDRVSREISLETHGKSYTFLCFLTKGYFVSNALIQDYNFL